MNWLDLLWYMHPIHELVRSSVVRAPPHMNWLDLLWYMHPHI